MARFGPAVVARRGARRIRRSARPGAQRSRRQRPGDVEGAGTAAVAGGHRSGAARAGQPRAVGTAAGPGRGCAGGANSPTGTRCRALGVRTGGHTRAVGVAGGRAALRRTGLARGEPVAPLLLGATTATGTTGAGHGVGPRVGVHWPARTGGRVGVRGGGPGRTCGVGGLPVGHGCAHDDRRDRPGSGDVDADPRRQRGLGLGLFRPVTGTAPRVGGAVGSHRRSVRRSPRRVCGSPAPVGPGGRTVSFTTQGRFSWLAPPPGYSTSTSIRAARRRAPPYWPLVSPILRPSGKPTPDVHLRAVAKWYVTSQVGRRRRPVAVPGQGWRTSQPRPYRRAGRGRSPLPRRRGSRPRGGWR